MMAYFYNIFQNKLTDLMNYILNNWGWFVWFFGSFLLGAFTVVIWWLMSDSKTDGRNPLGNIDNYDKYHVKGILICYAILLQPAFVVASMYLIICRILKLVDDLFKKIGEKIRGILKK